MNSYIEIIKTYLAANEPNYGGGDFRSLLEFLHWHYTESNPISNEKIKAGFQQVYAYFQHLNHKEVDAVFDAVNDLCYEHEYLAFREGIHIGIRLMTELSEDQKPFLTIDGRK